MVKPGHNVFTKIIAAKRERKKAKIEAKNAITNEAKRILDIEMEAAYQEDSEVLFRNLEAHGLLKLPRRLTQPQTMVVMGQTITYMPHTNPKNDDVYNRYQLVPSTYKQSTAYGSQGAGMVLRNLPDFKVRNLTASTGVVLEEYVAH